MKKEVIIVLLGVFLVGFISANCPESFSYCGNNCIKSYNADIECVREAVNNADYGYVIEIHGDAIWTEELVITKGIHLKGVSSTIKMNIGGTNSAILINPDSASISQGHIFEISGFVFDGDNSETIAIYLNGPRANNFPIAKIHNNTFQNFAYQTLTVANVWKGVVYNNTWKNNSAHSFRYMGGNAPTWNALKHYSYGTEEVIFFEDNNFLDLVAVASSGGQSTRVVLRYNNYSLARSLYPLVDVHGNQLSGVCATMGWEMYKNNIIGNGYTARYDLRGGRGMLFDNLMFGGSFTPRVRNEYCNDAIGTCARNQDTQTFNIQDSYHFLNKQDGNVRLTSFSSSNCDSELQENREFWNENNNFVPGQDTSLLTGVAIGTRAQMDIITTCIEGVGFWVIDEGEWDSTNSRADGRLYRCDSNNNWELYYTPYIYPHPLRLENSNYVPPPDTTPPILSNPQPTGNLSAGTTSTTISLDTNEAATCRYSITPGVSYSSMTNTFSTTGILSHSQLITNLQDGETYLFYVRCNDNSGNFNTEDFEISFSVLNSGEQPQPTYPEKIITLQDMLNSYQDYRQDRITIETFLEILRTWIVFR